MKMMNKKRIALLLAVALLLGTLPLYAVAEEVPAQTQASTTDVPTPITETVTGLVNGDFEDGTNGWTLRGDTALSDDARNGSGALYLCHGTAYAEAATQIVTLNAATDYTLTFWVKRVSGSGAWKIYVMDHNDNYAKLTYTTGVNWFKPTDNGWVQHTVTFNSGNRTEVFLKLCPETEDSGTFVLDDMRLYVSGEEPEEPSGSEDPLTLLSFGVVNNRPISTAVNLVTNGSFESGTGPWDTDSFLGDTVQVVNDSTTFEGGKSLFFNTSGSETPEWHIFWVEVEPGTDYVFSAWLKGSFLSPQSVGRATVGVIDPHTKKFLAYPRKDKELPGGMFSNDSRQLVPNAWDQQWHLRSVSFNSRDKNRVGVALYGYGTELWVDGLALFKVGEGVKFVSENAKSNITPAYDAEHGTCAPEDSLTQNPTMADAASDFWQTGKGWKNGFLSFVDSAYEYGRSLKYTGSETHEGVYYIKWLDVQPHTKYTFTAAVKVLESGEGKLALIDGKLRDSVNFVEVNFSREDYGDDWFTLCFTFNSDANDHIGIGVCDLGGVALLDNIRLFETEHGIDGEEEYVVRPDGWYKENGGWCYYQDGGRLTKAWKKDGNGWCYLGDDGYMVKARWIHDGSGWYYLNGSGYMVADKWVKDSSGWCYLTGSGRMATNAWIKDSVGWCYVGANGYCVTNAWKKDSKGWCYLDASGRMAVNKWINDGSGWYFLDKNGYMVANRWVKDSVGWCYLTGSGRMATNAWIKDSVGWCYVGKSGYCLTNQWVKDSKGWCFLDKNGRMVYSRWIKDGGKYYYIDQNGYMIAGKTVTIGGKKYTFDKNGVMQ
ncbi:MAG: carbohydrate binding domain-containing protein [Clostridia bacterium]|nr:carbohydrate binding domain-containing protein [Clostridia bacterium]